MKRNYILFGVGLILASLIVGIYFWSKDSNVILNNKTSSVADQNNNSNNQNSDNTTPPEDEKKSNDYFFPLPDYFSRISVKHFGQLVKTSDKFDVTCGAEFSGIHDGDDLEVKPDELENEVPVHAVAAGKVLQVGHVSGYGGLLVQSAKLNGDDVTIYYGHINYLTSKVKNGEEITPNEVVAFLGKGCSSETDGERKHLHFAIHKGTSVDVRGYVPDENTLSKWTSPGEMLKGLNASEPSN